MKKTFGVIALGLFLSLNMLSQNNNEVEFFDNVKCFDNEVVSFPRHEIRLNLLTAVLGIPEVNYEYFVQDNFGVGIALQAGLEDFTDMSYRAGAIPYGRLYFGHMPNSGFFIEGSAGLIYEKFYETYIIQGQRLEPQLKKEKNLGLGVAVGYKFLAKNNWVGDIQIGAGRIFGHTDFGAYPRFGISIGKRF